MYNFELSFVDPYCHFLAILKLNSPRMTQKRESVLFKNFRDGYFAINNGWYY
jgi:hypothetical protein